MCVIKFYVLQPNGYAVYVGYKDRVWLSDFAANASYYNRPCKEAHQMECRSNTQKDTLKCTRVSS